MRPRRERDVFGRPICTVCGEPIRAIEVVLAPDGACVHFYCLAIARGHFFDMSNLRSLSSSYGFVVIPGS